METGTSMGTTKSKPIKEPPWVDIEDGSTGPAVTDRDRLLPLAGREHLHSDDGSSCCVQDLVEAYEAVRVTVPLDFATNTGDNRGVATGAPSQDISSTPAQYTQAEMDPNTKVSTRA